MSAETLGQQTGPTGSYNWALEQIAALTQERDAANTTASELRVAYDAMEQECEKVERERGRYKLKAEQYAAQLDDRWAGVVGVTNKSVEDIRQLERERDQLRERCETLARELVDAGLLHLADESTIVQVREHAASAMEQAATSVAGLYISATEEYERGYTHGQAAMTRVLLKHAAQLRAGETPTP